MEDLASTFCSAPNSLIDVTPALSSSSESNKFYLAPPPDLRFLKLSLKEPIKPILAGQVQF